MRPTSARGDRLPVMLAGEMAVPEGVERAREAFARLAWKEACDRFVAADSDVPLSPADLELFATAAYLCGKDAEAEVSWRRAYHALVDDGKVERAARCGFWLISSLLLRGDFAQGTGWLARSQRLLDERQDTCVEEGYILLTQGVMALGKGDFAAARAVSERAIAIATRFADADLMALSLLTRGQALVKAHSIEEAATQFDEAMVAVTSGEVSPIAAGIVYCGVILACTEVFDLRRAQEWTNALSTWCAAQPDLVPFRGPCLVHRSEILQVQGEWSVAADEAARACEWFSNRPQRFAGRAAYQRAELYRLRGELDRAEELYRDAGHLGYEPQPGVSLLRLAQGRLEAAVAAIRRVVDEAAPPSRPAGQLSAARSLGAYVDIMVAAGDREAAGAAAATLAEIAAAVDAPFLHATSQYARGAVLLAGDDARAALAALRDAWALWQKLEAPYEAGRTRVLIGLACRRLGDCDTGQLHIDAARSVFERLGAATECSRLDQLDRAAADPERACPLTERELEVLTLVAAGSTNRQVAAELGISEHTVARHLSNIFNKLGVSSRTAAITYAFENHLL